MKLVSCQFCAALHEPHEWREASLTCTRCWLEIAAANSRETGTIMKDDFDRYADEQEHRADMMRDAQKVRHDLDHTEYVEECPFCESEEEPENEND